MTVPNLESSQTSGSSGVPSPAPSGGEGVSPSSPAQQSQVPYEQLVEKLNRIAGEVNALKGDKDKGVNAVKQEVSSIKETLAKYEKLRAKGIEPEEAMDEVENGTSMRDQLRSLQEAVSRLAAGGSVGSAVSSTSVAAQVFAQKGLDVNDPDVSIAISELAGKPAEAIELAAYRLKERKAGQPQSKPAQGAPIQGGPPPTPNKAEDIEAGYLAEIAKVPRGAAGSMMRDQIKRKWREEARKAGLQLNV